MTRKKFFKKWWFLTALVLVAGYFITKPIFHKMALDAFIKDENRLGQSFYRYAEYESVYNSSSFDGILHGVSVFYFTDIGKFAIKAPKAYLSVAPWDPFKIKVTFEDPDIIYYDDKAIYGEFLPASGNVTVGYSLSDVDFIDLKLGKTEILHGEFFSKFKSLDWRLDMKDKGRGVVNEDVNIQIFQLQTDSLCHYLSPEAFEIADIFVDTYPLSVLSFRLNASYDFARGKKIDFNPSVMEIRFPERMFAKLELRGSSVPAKDRDMEGSLHLPKNAKITFALSFLLREAGISESWHDMILNALQPTQTTDHQTRTHYVVPFSLKGHDIFIGPQQLFKLGSVPF